MKAETYYPEEESYNTDKATPTWHLHVGKTREALKCYLAVGNVYVMMVCRYVVSSTLEGAR